MAKNNNHKKLFGIDWFGRRYYCQNARLRQLRDDKKMAKKQARIERKKSIELELCDPKNDGIV